MNPDVLGYLAKAGRYIGSAKVLLREGDMDSAASRVYYAMFYCAEALLISEGLRFSSHRGVIASFGERFVKSGMLSPDYHEWLRDAFDKRQYGDYQVMSGLEKVDIRLLIERALKFLEVTRNMLDDRGTGPVGTKEPPARYGHGRKTRKAAGRKMR